MTNLKHYRTKSQILQDDLRARIMAGELPPGTRLIIRALAETFQCSDIPVREALRALETEGLINIIPHGGARVSDLPGSELIELTEARSLLEHHATVEAARHMPKAEVALLKEHLAGMQRALRDHAASDYGKLNRRFHEAILVHCPNATLRTLISDLWDRAERGRAVHGLFEGHVDVSMRQHEEIVHCIANRDFERLHDVSVVHSAHGLNAVRRLVEEDMRLKRLNAAKGA
jgi:DNA-binding GntR family transcriptional regulator